MPADNSAETPVRNFLSAVGRGFVRLRDAIRRAAQIQRLRNGIRRRQKDRRRILLAIGEKVYGLYVIDRVRNAEITDDCAQIDALITEIEQLKTRITELKAPEKLPELIVEPEDSSFLTDEPTPDAQPAAPSAEQADNADAASQTDTDTETPASETDTDIPETENSPAPVQKQDDTGAAAQTPDAVPPESGDDYDDDLDLDDDLSMEIDLA